MKAATMALNMLDYAIVYIPSFFKDIIIRPKKHISATVIVMALE